MEIARRGFTSHGEKTRIRHCGNRYGVTINGFYFLERLSLWLNSPECVM